MTEASNDAVDPDDDFDEDEFILGAPLWMPRDVWEECLNATFNSAAEVDTSLYPDAAGSGYDGENEGQALGAVDVGDNDPGDLYVGQEPDFTKDWDHHDDGY